MDELNKKTSEKETYPIDNTSISMYYKKNRTINIGYEQKEKNISQTHFEWQLWQN